MAKLISKTFTVTRVSFKTVAVENGIPSFVDHSDAVFNGMQEREKVEKLLKARLGKDAVIVITNIEAGQHRYAMSLEDFVLCAKIVDNEGDEGNAQGEEREDAPNDANDDQEDPFTDNPNSGGVLPTILEASIDIGL